MQRTLRRIGFEHVLGTLMTAVTGFGLWVTIRAMSVLAHGGNASFEGPFKMSDVVIRSFPVRTSLRAASAISAVVRSPAAVSLRA